MVSKTTGAPLEVGANIRTVDDILAAINAADPAVGLAHLKSIAVEGGLLPDEVVTVHHVASASLLQDGAGVRVSGNIVGVGVVCSRSG